MADDVKARLAHAIEQATGEAMQLAAEVAAFHARLIRDGMAPSEANSMAAAYINSMIQARVLRESINEQNRRGEGWQP